MCSIHYNPALVHIMAWRRPKLPPFCMCEINFHIWHLLNVYILFHWNMFPWVQSTLNPQTFRQRIGTEKKTSKNPWTQPMHMSLAVDEWNGNYSQQRRDLEKVAPYELSWLQFRFILPHYSDVTLSLMASQITSISIVCSTVFFWRISKIRVTEFCEGKSPLTDGFPLQSVSNAENFSIWIRHHDEIPWKCHQ